MWMLDGGEAEGNGQQYCKGSSAETAEGRAVVQLRHIANMVGGWGVGLLVIVENKICYMCMCSILRLLLIIFLLLLLSF